MLFDLKVINSVLSELEEERNIPRDKVLGAIANSLAAAYKKEYGKKGQIIRAEFNSETGTVDYYQVKIVVDDSLVYQSEYDEDGNLITNKKDEDERTRFNPEHHMMIEDARRIKKDVELDDEITFPLEEKEDFGRIAAQTAKQVIMQSIREAEKYSILEEYGEKEGTIISGHVQRFERGNLFIDLGRATAIMPYEEQIPGERYRQGERIRAYLYKVDESPRGTFLKLSRSHPQFLVKLFETEAPELANGTIEIKAVAREAGSRSKIAVAANDDGIDPVGSLVGQRGVRVATVTSELGGEKIDVIEWVEDPAEFIEQALSPAQLLDIILDEENNKATAEVTEDQQSLAIGRGGQNVRLAAKLTGWAIDIHSVGGDEDKEVEEDVKENKEEKKTEEAQEPESIEKSADDVDSKETTDKETEDSSTADESKEEVSGESESKESDDSDETSKENK